VAGEVPGYGRITPETILAALHGNRLTWKNSGLNTGAQIARSGSQREEQANKEPREALMGKSDRKKTIKKVVKTTRKAVGKLRAKAALNGSGRLPAKTKKLVAKITRRGRARQSSIVLPEGYRPSESEPFMSERQRIYFRIKLVSWKEEIVRQNRETLHVLHEDSAQHADLADRATSETDRALELRARDRQRKLIAKIDAALMRIEEGTYGYCEETGEPIGLKRLDARPIATLSLEAQERHERREKVFREQ
jgi:DnaK suppressor protein